MATNDLSKTWGVSPQERDLIGRRAATRMKLRKEYQRLLFSPYQHGTGEGGYLFDPMMQRYVSMKASSFQFFRPSVQNGLIAIALVAVPILGSLYYYKKDRERKLTPINEGRVAYADRGWKQAL